MPSNGTGRQSTTIQNAEGVPAVSAETAIRIATDYLLDHVGDLVSVGAPCLDGQHWVLPVLRSNVVSGFGGQIGTLRVDAATGDVAFAREAAKR